MDLKKTEKRLACNRDFNNMQKKSLYVCQSCKIICPDCFKNNYKQQNQMSQQKQFFCSECNNSFQKNQFSQCFLLVNTSVNLKNEKYETKIKQLVKQNENYKKVLNINQKIKQNKNKQKTKLEKLFAIIKAFNWYRILAIIILSLIVLYSLHFFLKPNSQLYDKLYWQKYRISKNFIITPINPKEIFLETMRFFTSLTDQTKIRLDDILFKIQLSLKVSIFLIFIKFSIMAISNIFGNRIKSSFWKILAINLCFIILAIWFIIYHQIKYNQKKLYPIMSLSFHILLWLILTNSIFLRNHLSLKQQQNFIKIQQEEFRQNNNEQIAL